MEKLTVAVVGLNMGLGHVNSYANLPEYELAAICDINLELAKDISDKYNNVPYYNNYTDMLRIIKPDVVCVATPTALHCEMTLEAIGAGVKGVYCEKPIAINMREARAMDAASNKSGTQIVVGHQRRVSAPYRTMKKVIADGMIGDIYLARGMCAGDILSDVTHTIDSLLYFNNDCDIEWLLGQIYRGKKASREEYEKDKYTYIGTRFGHNIEKGAMACFQLSNGVRCEIFSGRQMLMPGRVYQDIEVFGSAGRIWRNNDSANPQLQINTKGFWEEYPVYHANYDNDSGVNNAHKLFAQTILEGKPHPLCIANAMRGFEAVMAIFESARTTAIIEMPLRQDEYPLDVLLRERGDI